jgi:heme-degrading monooxygenase HmoA
MIARIWRGVVELADAEVYADYIRETGFAEYGRTPGNRGAWMLRRDTGDRTEFITLSLWETIDAIRAFAGDNIEAAVLYPEDERFLVDGLSTVDALRGGRPDLAPPLFFSTHEVPAQRSKNDERGSKAQRAVAWRHWRTRVATAIWVSRLESFLPG